MTFRDKLIKKAVSRGWLPIDLKHPGRVSFEKNPDSKLRARIEVFYSKKRNNFTISILWPCPTLGPHTRYIRELQPDDVLKVIAGPARAFREKAQ